MGKSFAQLADSRMWSPDIDGRGARTATCFTYRLMGRLLKSHPENDFPCRKSRRLRTRLIDVNSWACARLLKRVQTRDRGHNTSVL
jgi:hypothetical protein